MLAEEARPRLAGRSRVRALGEGSCHCRRAGGRELPAVHSYVLCSRQEVEDEEEKQQASNIWLPGENV